MHTTGNGALKTTLSGFLRSFYVPGHLDLTPGTVEQYAISCRHLARFLGREPSLGDLSDRLILGWLSARMKVAAPKTVNRNRADVLALWRWGNEYGYCDRGPGKIPKAKVPTRLPLAWSIEELTRILEVTRRLTGEMRGTEIGKAVWWTSLTLTFYDTGVRLEPMLQVAPAHVDLNSLAILFIWESDKTNLEHWERISQQTADAIAKHYDAGRQYVWPYPWNRRQIWPQFKRILQAAGLPFDRYRMFHCMRRTHATHVAANGSPELARQSLGHTTQAMTDRYIDPRMMNHPSAVDVLPRPELGGSGDRQMRLFD